MACRSEADHRWTFKQTKKGMRRKCKKCKSVILEVSRSQKSFLEDYPDEPVQRKKKIKPTKITTKTIPA